MAAAQSVRAAPVMTEDLSTAEDQIEFVVPAGHIAKREPLRLVKACPISYMKWYAFDLIESKLQKPSITYTFITPVPLPHGDLYVYDDCDYIVGISTIGTYRATQEVELVLGTSAVAIADIAITNRETETARYYTAVITIHSTLDNIRAKVSTMAYNVIGVRDMVVKGNEVMAHLNLMKGVNEFVVGWTQGLPRRPVVVVEPRTELAVAQPLALATTTIQPVAPTLTVAQAQPAAAIVPLTALAPVVQGGPSVIPSVGQAVVQPAVVATSPVLVQPSAPPLIRTPSPLRSRILQPTVVAQPQPVVQTIRNPIASIVRAPSGVTVAQPQNVDSRLFA
jgi:hypothetical protein